MTIRTDIHRPSAIEPSEYEFVAHDYHGPIATSDYVLAAERQYFREHMARTGGKFANHEHGGSCHVCGATAFYVAKFHHPKTNSYIVTGEDCAEKMHMGDARAFRVFRDRVHADHEANAGKRKAEKVLREAGLEAAWAVYMTNSTDRAGFKYEEKTISDIVSKLVRYGSVSERQLAFVRVLLDKILARKEIEAKRAAEAEAAAPVPVVNGRMVIVGKVLSTKVQEGRFGSQLKMLVQADSGFKVWGTVPSSLTVERGDRVQFEAAVTPSNDDPKFGFFSRPSKAVTLAAANEGVM